MELVIQAFSGQNKENNGKSVIKGCNAPGFKPGTSLIQEYGQVSLH